jgi:hypothetical protein
MMRAFAVTLILAAVVRPFQGRERGAESPSLQVVPEIEG